jgi:hypothetical protein
VPTRCSSTPGPRLVADRSHWQPLWGERPSESVARLLAGIRTSEPYYADTLRQHVTLVARVLHSGAYWPPSFPLLVEASQLRRLDRTVAPARRIRDAHPDLWRRVSDHQEWAALRDGVKALSGGLVRLELVIGDTWRSALTPRLTPDGQTGAGVSIAAAIRAGAIVLWRTHIDQMPDEANAITAVALVGVVLSGGEQLPAEHRAVCARRRRSRSVRRGGL